MSFLQKKGPRGLSGMGSDPKHLVGTVPGQEGLLRNLQRGFWFESGLFESTKKRFCGKRGALSRKSL